MPQPCPDKNPLQRSGISQPQRRLPALQPENTLLDERKPEDLLRFLALYAQEARIRFFDATNTPDNGAVWADLMNFERYFTLDELETRHDIEPHFALVLAFLHLFEKLQAHQNTLTKRHLDFYYREVLQLSRWLRFPTAFTFCSSWRKTLRSRLFRQKPNWMPEKTKNHRNSR